MQIQIINEKKKITSRSGLNEWFPFRSRWCFCCADFGFADISAERRERKNGRGNESEKVQEPFALFAAPSGAKLVEGNQESEKQTRTPPLAEPRSRIPAFLAWFIPTATTFGPQRPLYRSSLPAHSVQFIPRVEFPEFGSSNKFNGACGPSK
jgi:hypothetical protein